MHDLRSAFVCGHRFHERSTDYVLIHAPLVAAAAFAVLLTGAIVAKTTAQRWKSKAAAGDGSVKIRSTTSRSSGGGVNKALRDVESALKRFAVFALVIVVVEVVMVSEVVSKVDEFSVTLYKWPVFSHMCLT